MRTSAGTRRFATSWRNRRMALFASTTVSSTTSNHSRIQRLSAQLPDGGPYGGRPEPFSRASRPYWSARLRIALDSGGASTRFGSAGSVLRVSITRFGVPRSFHPQEGTLSTWSLGAWGSRRAREKSTVASRWYTSASDGVDGPRDLIPPTAARMSATDDWCERSYKASRAWTDPAMMNMFHSAPAF